MRVILRNCRKGTFQTPQICLDCGQEHKFCLRDRVSGCECDLNFRMVVARSHVVWQN